MVDITDIPDVIPTDDITQPERTVTTVVVQWKEPNYYNAPIIIYTLDLCQKVEGECRNVTININNAGEHTSDGIVRYGLLLVIVDVLM